MSGSNSKHDDLNTMCDYLKTIKDHSSIIIDVGSKENLEQEGLFCFICLLKFSVLFTLELTIKFLDSIIKRFISSNILKTNV